MYTPPLKLPACVECTFPATAAGRPEIASLPFFIFGESMGGAVAIKTHWKRPHSWRGAVFLAPMVKVGYGAPSVFLAPLVKVGQGSPTPLHESLSLHLLQLCATGTRHHSLNLPPPPPSGMPGCR